MFLSNLDMRQKNAFLKLAHTLIAADGVLSADETSMMQQYQQEMQMSDVEAASAQSVEHAEGIFDGAPITVKKQVMFELVALACADTEYAEEENALLEKLSETFGLDTAFLAKCQDRVQELTGLYGEIMDLVAE